MKSMLKPGDKFTEVFVVSDDIYKGFVKLFKDKNPLHIDEKYAIEKGFEDIVMHGNMLNGFLSYFIGECLPIRNVVIHSQNIKYIKPVYLYDKLHLFAQIDDVFESVNVVEISFVFSNQDAVKVAKGSISIGLI